MKTITPGGPRRVFRLAAPLSYSLLIAGLASLCGPEALAQEDTPTATAAPTESATAPTDSLAATEDTTRKGRASAADLLPPNAAIPFRLKVIPTKRHPSEAKQGRPVPLPQR